MTCCLMEGKIRCLPYFIIAGTQKSGTTVLSAYLSEHPQIKFHMRKEVLSLMLPTLLCSFLLKVLLSCMYHICI